MTHEKTLKIVETFINGNRKQAFREFKELSGEDRDLFFDNVSEVAKGYAIEPEKLFKSFLVQETDQNEKG